MVLLSVIIPVYNAEPWLQECLDSILHSLGEQRNLAEILLINDGSTDDSGRICQDYAAQWDHVHVFHKENGGVSTARNLGLDHACGQYLAWVDPDDVVSADWFPRIWDAIQHGQPDVIVMDSIRFGNGSEVPEVYGRPAGVVERDLFVEDVIRDLRMLSGMPNKVMKAELFDGVRFDPSLPIMEDYAAIPQLLNRANTVFYVDACLYRYRQHPNSLLHTGNPERAFQSVQIAMAREQAVEPRFRKAAVTATAMQAFQFCWHWYHSKAFQQNKAHLRFCKQYIRRNLWQISRDGELSKGMRMKMMLLRRW